jgi:Zn-dependent protease with chaperone function
VRTDVTRASRHAYALSIGLGGAALALAGASTLAAAAGTGIVSGRGHVLDLAGVRLAAPAASPLAVLSIALAALGVAVVISAIRAATTVVVSLQRLRRALPIVGPLDSDPSVLVIDDARPGAFCAGLWRPRVYVTAGALDTLSPRELRAVLAHEATHRRERHPLRVVSTEVLSRAVFFVPALRSVSARFAVLTELVADDGAVAEAGPAAVARAMLVLGADGIEADRVDRLAGEGPPRWRLPATVVALSGAALGALVILAIVLLRHVAEGRAVALPVLAGKPCVVTLAALPLVAAVTARACWRAPAR